MFRNSQRPEVAENFRKAIVDMYATGELKDIFFGKAGRPERLPGF